MDNRSGGGVLLSVFRTSTSAASAADTAAAADNEVTVVLRVEDLTVKFDAALDLIEQRLNPPSTAAAKPTCLSRNLAGSLRTTASACAACVDWKICFRGLLELLLRESARGSGSGSASPQYRLVAAGCLLALPWGPPTLMSNLDTLLERAGVTGGAPASMAVVAAPAPMAAAAAAAAVKRATVVPRAFQPTQQHTLFGPRYGSSSSSSVSAATRLSRVKPSSSAPALAPVAAVTAPALVAGDAAPAATIVHSE